MLNRHQNPNKLIAEFGLNYAKKRFPLGGLNRQDVLETNSVLAITQLEIITRLRTKTTNSPDFKECADLLQGGCCGELSYMTRTAIKEKYPQTSVEVVDLSHHQLLVIGRKSNSDPNRMTDWVSATDEGYLLDVWAGEFYPISEFSEKNLFEPGIPFYEFGADGVGQLITQHHLSGIPKISPDTNHYRINDKASIAALIATKKISIGDKIYEIVDDMKIYAAEKKMS